MSYSERHKDLISLVLLMWDAFAMWVAFVALILGTIQVITFVLNLVLGLAVLIWFTVYIVLLFFCNCIYSVLYAIEAMANEALVQFYRPFAALEAFLGRLETITLTVLQLSLRTLYYIVVFWLLVYILNLLYHFVQHRDFVLQGKFYSGPSLCWDHFGQSQ